MINLIEKQIVLLDRIVQVSVCRTECGIQVLIAGGDRLHIGAVSIVDENSNLISHVFEGHKDYVISDRWAVKLYEHFLVPVVVSAGIHYDEITPDGIKTVIEEMEKLLEEVMAYE